MIQAAVIDAELRQRLASLAPERVELIDDSHHHAGHAGAQGGRHYRLTIVASTFANQNTVARHRLVYAAAGDLMRGPVHALTITALTPAEYAERTNAAAE